jgi:hypothetical protein
VIRYQTTVTIDRPPSEDMTDWRWLSPGPPRVGSRGQFRLPGGPFKGPLGAEIVELEPDRRVVFEVDHPAVAWRAVSIVEPTGAGTRLTYGGDMRLRGWRRLLEPFIGGEVRRGEAREAERLRDILEAAPPASEPSASSA